MGTELEDYTINIKTQDSIFLQFHISSDVHNNYAIASEGFGTETCHLTSTSSSEKWPFNLAWQVEFVVDCVCSVHALAQCEGKSKTKRAVVYGSAIKLKHAHSDKFLSCKGTPWTRDKLSYTIHLQPEDNDNCWFMIVPGQVTRSEGEKVRFGDDVLLKSIYYDRYLCADTDNCEDVNSSPITSPDLNFWWNPDDTESASYVIASFKKTLWCLQLFTSNVAREQDIGNLCGQESVQFFCRHTTSYLMADSSEKDVTEGLLVFEPTDHKNEVQSIWRVELLQLKWGGLHLQWGQPFRLRHMITGKFLGSHEDKNRYSLVLLSEDVATCQNSVFYLRKNVEDVSQWEQREDQFFKPQIKLGDSQCLLQHFPNQSGPRGADSHPLWLGFATGAVEDETRSSRSAMFLSQGINYKYALTITTTSTEKSKGATNVYITDRIINTFRRIVSEKPLHTQFGPTCKRLIEILNEFSSHFDKFTTHEGLFKSFLSLASDVEKIYKTTFTAGPPKLSHARLSRGTGSPSVHIKEIKSSLLDTLAEFLKKHNPECCRHFAQADNLKLFLSMVEDPKYNRKVLTVLLNAFHENSEILNSFKETYIDRIIMLFSCFGRNEKILELLTSLCLCNGTAIRRNQNVICEGLLKQSSIQNLLLKTINVNKIHVMRTSFCISRHPDSATYPKWYYELELDDFPYSRNRETSHFRVGWIALDYFSDLPSYDSSRRGEGDQRKLSLSEGGVGDDLYSYGFDGRSVWTGGVAFKSSNPPDNADCTTKCVIGCYIDLSQQNMHCWFSLNGVQLEPQVTGISSSHMVCPAVSFSSDIRCYFRLGDKFGDFIHNPDPEFLGIASARSPDENRDQEITPSDLFSSASAISSCPLGPHAEGTNCVRIEGPAAIDDDCSFVPTPIDVTDIPSTSLNLTQHIAEYLHDVWAVNKIDFGWDFGEKRNDEKKLHPLLIPFSELNEEQKKYDLDLAQETIKTLKALGYDIKAPTKPGFRAKKVPLNPDKYKLCNGYLPALYNLDALEELPALHDMIERLAENTHRLWARNKVSNGFCYGSNANSGKLNVSSSLVPYDRLGKRDKISNRASVKGVVEALIARGYSILSMRSDHEILELARNVDFSSIKTITYRTQTSYGVSEGLWYYDVTLETAGFMRIGWATSEFRAGRLLGSGGDSYAYDGYLARKWNKESVTFGQRWKSGDKIRCYLNLKEGTICFACNDSLLRGTQNDTVAFSDIPRGNGVKYYPAVSLGRGQKVEISFTEGQDMKSYQLVDEYSPFSKGVHTCIPLWYSLEDSHYEPISSHRSHFCLSPEVDLLVISEMTVQLKSLPQDPQLECLRLNLGVPLDTPSPVRKNNLICFGVRVQICDIGKAYLGWTTSSFKFFPHEGDGTWGQECTVSGDPPTILKTAYLLPLSKLTDLTHQEDHVEVYTVLDREKRVITYHLSYDSECKGESFQLAASVLKLFPTFVISPSKRRVFDFLLDPLTDRISLSAAILSSTSHDTSHRSMRHSFPWMELQVAASYSWTYRENTSIHPTIERAGGNSCSLVYEEFPSSPLPMSTTGLGDKLAPSTRKLLKMRTICSSFESTDSIEDRYHCLYVLVPEEETLFRFTDISERPVLADFLNQSFRLFNAICYHVFSSAVDSVQNYVTKDTLLAMMSLALKFYLPNDLKLSIYNLYITLNFERESMCCLWTRNDFVFSAEFPDNPTPYLPIPGKGQFSAQPSIYSEPGDDSMNDIHYSKFKRFLFSKLNEVLLHKEYACRSLTHQDHIGLFVPILRIIRHMLLTDQLNEEDMNKLIYLLDPSRSTVNIGSHLQLGSEEAPERVRGQEEGMTGLLNIENLEETVKYEICVILDYMYDKQLKNKIRILVEFSGSMAYKLRAEQATKHKQLDEQLKHSPSFAMQKTKQFRLRPLAQVCEMLGVSEEGPIGDNPLRDEIDRFHRDLLFRFDVRPEEKEGEFRSFLERHPSQEQKQSQLRALNSIIKDTLRGWVNSKVREPKLVCAIFNLLHRQFHEQEEFSTALEKTYILPSSRQPQNLNLISPSDILGALGHLRSLLQVRIDKSEQKSLTRYLHTLSEPRLVFHHPELLCSLQIHETVLNVMKHLLDDFQSKEQSRGKTVLQQTSNNFQIFQETISECCKYLCNLAKYSRVPPTATNSQRMLFPHLDYLLELSSVHNNNLNRGSDTSPMEVANAIIRNNERLALSLQEEQIRKVIDLLASAMHTQLLNHTEQYLEFLKLAVRASDCYIEENAKIIVTHLISNRTCLGPALDYSQSSGFGGYFTSTSSPVEDFLSADATLPYYISLLDLLAKCAPDRSNDTSQTSEVPICSVLQKIILEEDLRRLLECPLEPPDYFESGEFLELKNKKYAEEWSNFKGSILLFYEQVYSIKAATILSVIEDSIIPDMLYALCLCRVEIDEVALTLIKYITQFVIPFLQRTISNMCDRMISEALSAKLLHASYWLACLPVPQVQKNCMHRNPVSEYVQQIAKCLPPSTMYPLLSKVLPDLHDLPLQNRGIVILMLRAHFTTHCGYYSGANIDSTSAATPQEQQQLLQLAHFLLEETYAASGSKPAKLVRKSSELVQREVIEVKLKECLHAVIHALAPDMVVPEHTLSDTSFLLLPNKPLYFANSLSVDVSHPKILPSFNYPLPSSLMEPSTRLSPPQDLIHRLKQTVVPWMDTLHYRLECLEIPGIILDKERMLENLDSTIYLLLNAIMSKGIFFVHNPPQNGQTDTYSSKDFLAVIKNAFNIGLTKKDLRDKAWKRLMKSVSLAVLEFSSLLNNHIHFRSKQVKDDQVPIPYYLLQTREQEIVVEAVYEFFGLITNCGYKLHTTKQSSMSIESGGENFGRQTVTLLVVHELHEVFREKSQQLVGPGAGAYLRDILLPVISNYFREHRSYFVSDANQLVYMSMASQFELVEVARLFHLIIQHLHMNPDLFREERAQKEIRTALEWLCRCLHPFASNISVGNIQDENASEITETDSSNAVNYIENVISILRHSLEEKSSPVSGSLLTAILPVICVLIKQIGGIRQNAAKLHIDQAQLDLDKRMTDLFLSISTLVQSPDPPPDLGACGECLTAICCTRMTPLLEENFGEADCLYESIRERVLTASLESKEYVHVYLPLITKYIKRCNELKTEDKPDHNSDIQPIICSVIRFLIDNLQDEIAYEYQIVQCLELIVPHTPIHALWTVWRDLKQLIHSIRTGLISLWKAEQSLTAAEAGKGYNETEHANLEPRFNTLLPHLLSALMLLGRFLFSQEKELLTTLQEHEGEHVLLFWDLDLIFNCWQTSQYARQGLQGIIHAICNKFESMETASLLSERNDLSILIQLVLQTQKKVYNERCHILLYCIKTYLDLILNLDHFSGYLQVIESSENMFRSNNNIEYISQKLDQEHSDKRKSVSLSGYRTASLSNWYHLPESESLNSLKLDLMEIGRIKANIYNIEHPRAGRDRWRKFLTQHKKRAIMRSFQSVPIYKLPWFKISNHFLETYRSKWLSEEHKEADLISNLETDTRESEVGHTEGNKPLALLVGVFCEGDVQQTEQHDLYRKYASSLKESCACILPEDDDKISEAVECDNIFTQQDKKRKLEKQQLKLTEHKVAEMVVVVLAGSQGCRGDLVQETLQLGISLLQGGNPQVQENILECLHVSKEGGDFFTSMSRLIVGCPVLDRSTYERQRKVYGSMDNLQTAIKDDQFTQDLFRFLQLLCEGHNMSMQNYLRTQPDKTTTVNLVVFTVDYLLSLQESIQNFYGQYSGERWIDVQGQSNFKKVFKVVQQVFNTLIEYIQGPCPGNQLALSQSRLWDAISGFFYIFAKLQSKLSSEYEHSVELMKDVLDVHADMIILLLSMLEGNVSQEFNSISGQMKDALVESRQNLLEIVNFCCTFIDLNDVITSKGFQSYDQNKDGVVSRIEFETALSSQDKYSQSQMDYLMRCADKNQDGVIDYMEFMERFYTPCDRIGFNLSVLFTILFDHLFEGDANLELAGLREDTEKLRQHFRSYTGCIEIIGKSKKVEKVFFQIDKSNFEQWEKSQIQESKRNFTKHLDHEISTKDKMEKFMDFCEDTIFEMKHAAMLSQSAERERESRASEHHQKATDYFKMVPTDPVEKLAVNYKLHVDEVRNKWDRVRTSLHSFYSKLGLLRFILVIPILVEFCIGIGSALKQHFSPNSKRNYNGADQSYMPKIIGATRRFSSNLAQIDYLLRKSSMVIVFVLNLLLLFCNFDSLTGIDDDEKATTLMDITFSDLLDSVKLFLLHSISSLHVVLSGVLIWTYWQLKFPLIIFREEKSLCHAIEGNKEKLRLEFGKCMFLSTRWWDRKVLDSATFPRYYWNKLVRQEMRDEDTVEEINTYFSIDINYILWIVTCVMLTDYTLLSKVIYFIFSLFGKLYSPAFFCIHLLLDVYTNFETLRTIFYSIYHNKTRLVMSIFILLVVQLIFSIIGMYLFTPGDEVSLIHIFLYLVGQIPGGNLDISENFVPDENTPSAKDTTITMYSICYFFAIQLVLIALIQGLIIDAFGELRKKQEDAKVAMHTKCFICGLTKETFDQNTPRGFEMHTEKEHYFPNYLFFLMHLIHKKETEYTGQESYVMDMYRRRNWEFFPIGTYFSQKQITENK